MAYNHLLFPQGEHPKLLLGEDPPNAIKELTGIQNVSQCLLKRSYFTSISASSNCSEIFKITIKI